MVDFAKLLKRAPGEPRPNSPEDLGVHKGGAYTNRLKLDPPERFIVLGDQLLGAISKVKDEPEERIAGLRYLLAEIEVTLQAEKERS